jgi:DNA topoisomerase IA
VAPPAFTTGTLLVEAARRLRFRPGKTMALAQRLYEGVALGEGGRTGLITYPRTGSARVSAAADRAARALVAATGGPSEVGAPLDGGAAGGLDGGHEAVRPASFDLPPEQVADALRAAGGRDLARLYALVWERFVDSRRVPPGRPAEPFPDRLDDAGLLEALLARGVGRPSTLPAIGDSLLARGYLERGGGALRVTPLGRRVVGWLDRSFPGTLDAGYTATLECRLDEVEAGRVGWREAVAAAWSPLERILTRVVA